MINVAAGHFWPRHRVVIVVMLEWLEAGIVRLPQELERDRRGPSRRDPADTLTRGDFATNGDRGIYEFENGEDSRYYLT